MSLNYESLSFGSLNGGSHVANGLQTTSIYWESWQTPFKGIFGGLYGGKWSWKSLDNDIRRFLRLELDTLSTDGMLFAEFQSVEVGFARQYQGASDFTEAVASRERANFTFFPTGLSAT